MFKPTQANFIPQASHGETYGGPVLLEWRKSNERRKTTFRNPCRGVSNEAGCFVTYLRREFGTEFPLL